MSTRQPMALDAVLKDALNRRADGSSATADLIRDVMTAVSATSQERGWGLVSVSRQRWLVIFAALLLLSAVIGFVATGGGRDTTRLPVATPPALPIATPAALPVATPATPDGGGDVAFVQARYEWDGSRDGYGGETPTAGEQRIFSIPSEGGVPTYLGEVPAASRQPLVGASTVGPMVRWSPDGSRIAFRRLVDDPGIYVMNRDGSGLTRLTDLPEPGWSSMWGRTGRGFAWSPDGTRIAFRWPMAAGSMATAAESSSLYVVDANTGLVSELTGPNADGGVFAPIAWSPDGSRIAFARSRGPLRGATHSLVVMDADGSNEQRLVHVDDADVHGFAWSPDGSRIAFTRSSDGSRVYAGADGGLWVINADGTSLRLIDTGPWAGPTEVQAVHDGPFAWSPDGTFVATGGLGITLVPVDGSGERVIGSRDTWIDNFSWSPDGSQLVYSVGGQAATKDPPTYEPPSIYVVNSDGTGLRWLADGEYPDWSK